MGLIKAALGAAGGVLADQWKEYFVCESLDADVLMAKGEKRSSGRSSNTKGSDNVITNGSGISVADGQCMIIVDQGKIVEFCAEPGVFTWDASSEPSLFSGKLGESLKETFKTIGKRFTFGGFTGNDQRVYYFNTKEIIGNKFGTPSPFMFDVVNKEIGYSRTVKVRCNGVYSYKITDPLLFYKEIAGNVEQYYTRDEIDQQLKTEFISALQPAFSQLSLLELRPSQIPSKTNELKDAMNEALKMEWTDRRGISVVSIALNPITLTDEDMEKINKMEDAVAMGKNAFMMAGRMADSTANAMENASQNEAGAMNGFIGMGMAMNANGGGFNQAQSFYNMGMQQQQAQQQQQAMQQQAMQQPMQQAQANQNAQPNGDTWTCSCGATVSGNFCTNCGAKKPEASSWTCSCGVVNTGNFCSNCGAKKPVNEEWTCSCGAVNKGNFCQNCGKPRS